MKLVASAQQTFARWFGILLLLIGIAGFFMDDMLVVFGVNTIHNIIHLVTGILGILASMSSGYAKTYNIGFGIIYLLVGILGFFSIAGIGALLNLNDWDNWLHLVIAIVVLAVGFKASTGAAMGME